MTDSIVADGGLMSARARIFVSVIASAALGAAALWGCGDSATEDGGSGDANRGPGTAGSKAVCTYDGVEHPAGTSFESPDGCGDCSCGRTGEVTCAVAACNVPCEIGGRVYQQGERFKDEQDCNTCQCDRGNTNCTIALCTQECEYRGQTYPPGELFFTDACNTCKCDLSGRVIDCSTGDCPGPCDVFGKNFGVGAQYPASDGCNTCRCLEDGHIACTTIGCHCGSINQVYDFVSSSSEECTSLRFGCPANTDRFSNSCGCGCAQDPSCPATFNCKPPADCDVDQIRSSCPYSTIAL